MAYRDRGLCRRRARRSERRRLRPLRRRPSRLAAGAGVRQQRDIAALRASLSAAPAIDGAGRCRCSTPRPRSRPQPLTTPDADRPSHRRRRCVHARIEPPLAEADRRAAMSVKHRCPATARAALEAVERAGAGHRADARGAGAASVAAAAAAADALAARAVSRRSSNGWSAATPSSRPVSDPLRRPCLPRQVRRRAHGRAGGIAAGGDRGVAIACSLVGWRLRLVAARLCAGAARRRGRGAVPDPVRGFRYFGLLGPDARLSP